MSAAADCPAWHEGPGIHESGLHVWVFHYDDGTTSVELDADTRLTLAEARTFASRFAGLLDTGAHHPGASPASATTGAL